MVTGVFGLERNPAADFRRSFSLASNLNLCRSTFWKLANVLGVESMVDFSGEIASLSLADSKSANILFVSAGG